MGKSQLKHNINKTVAGNSTTSLFLRVLSSLAVFTFAFLVSYLSGSHFTPVSNSDATGGISIVSNGAYYANITSSGTIDLTINSTPDGAYNLGKDSLSISTNSTLGYKLYISTIDHSSDSPALPSTTPSNGLINISDGSGGPGDNTKYVSPSTGTVTTPVLLETNTWGYATSRSTSSQSITEVTKANAAPTTTEGGSAIWKAVPVYGSEDLFYDNTTPSTASTNSVDVYYAANVSTALPSGEYSNTVVYTAIVEGTAPSSANKLTISPASQNGLVTTTNVTINTGLYTNFDIANLGTITATIGNKNCTSIVPSINITNGNLVITCNTPNQSSIDTIGSYDVAVTVTKDGQIIYSETLANGYTYNAPTGGTMQNFTCSTLTSVGNTVELLDSRDNKTYVVKKLADNRCWMVQNLRTVGPMKLTSADSNVSADFDLTASDDSTWCSDMTDTCINKSMVYGNSSTEYGAYYNWYAATAGTGTRAISSGNTTFSICPKGWNLPTSGSNSDFSALDIAYGGTGVSRQNANTFSKFTGSSTTDGNFTFAGSRTGGGQGDVGLWWASNPYNTSRANYLALRTSDNMISITSDGQNKYQGISVRCVAATKVENSVEYIKLADGNWWTKNSQGKVLWAQVSTVTCPSGSSHTTGQQFANLIAAYGATREESYGDYGYVLNSSSLYNAFGLSTDTDFWSIDEAPYGGSTHTGWQLRVYRDYSLVWHGGGGGNNFDVICIKN